MPGHSKRSTSIDIGREAERAARRFLEARGCVFIEDNYLCRMGEIDLVMRQDETLAFVEVRFRRRPDFGSGADSVDRRKQRRLIRAAQHYIQVRRIGERHPIRFDVVSLSAGRNGGYEIDWIPNAFETC